MTRFLTKCLTMKYDVKKLTNIALSYGVKCTSIACTASGTNIYCELEISRIRIPDISKWIPDIRNWNCWYQWFQLLISKNKNCWYQECAHISDIRKSMLLSRNRILYIKNSNCWYQQMSSWYQQCILDISIWIPDISKYWYQQCCQVTK